MSAAVCLFGTLAVAAEDTAHVTPLMQKDLPNYPGKEGLMISVEYGPGGSSPIHKHEANAFVYALEGSVVMQVKGQKEVTVSAGETYYESPTDIHLVSRNASNTKPAKFIVVLLKNKGAPVVLPVK
ncbi:cupin domain-containing protein (plasmid) [Rhizobium jaguaris]|uniref:Cupin domain-containing protein n=1 Tax=Rhizobium jaguaris TaxID=1312183 RepID=A0A387FYS3_9HYPH|nr:cupin domain-containing protein [Rhizobium jaguaris]